MMKLVASADLLAWAAQWLIALATNVPAAAETLRLLQRREPGTNRG